MRVIGDSLENGYGNNGIGREESKKPLDTVGKKKVMATSRPKVANQNIKYNNSAHL